MEAATVIDFPTMNRERFIALLREHHRGLLAYAMVLVKSEPAARELVQDASVAAWQSLAKFDVTRDFSGWMRGILRNKWRESCRRRRREIPLDEETLSRLEQPFEASPGDAALWERLAECRRRLPPPMAEAIRLTYDEGRTSDDAARVLATTPAALRKRLERAREALRRCLSHPVRNPNPHAE
jgi:RNA polymerase sigma-70 factor (ECF subfamily)